MISNRFKNDRIPLLNLNETQLLAKAEVESKIKNNQYKFESIICPVCKDKHLNFNLLAQKDRYGLAYDTVICKGCGLLFANPRMTQESYNEFYDKEYRRLYTSKDLSTLEFFEEQACRGLQIIDFIKTQFSQHNMSGKSVLEVGCGAGGILKSFRDEGCIITGLDLGQNYLNYGIEHWNLSLHNSDIHSFKFEKKPDIIIYSHVLEHILDLEKELRRIKDISHKDTLIYIEVPGLLNIHNVYGGDFLLYLQNAHTYNFSLQLLERLFNQNGFRLILGNEFIRAIFIIDEGVQASKKNMYEINLSYLKRLELKFKYPFCYKIKNKFRFLINRFFKFK